MEGEVELPAGAVQPEKTLTAKLSQVSLDVKFWTETLKTKCGITEPGQLRFADSSVLSKLQKCTRYSWEANALTELFGDQDGSPQKKKMKKKHEEQEEKSVKLLAEIQKLRGEGKDRNDEALKEKETELRQVLDIPDEMWRNSCPDVNFDDVISKMQQQLGQVTEMAKDRLNLSPTELVKSASGGLALRGILVTNDIEKCTEIRKMVIEAPEDIELLSPASSQRDDTVDFKSRTQSDRFSRSLDVLGHSVAVSAKGGGYGFQAEAGFNKDYKKESESESESHCNEVYVCREITSCMPTAVCELDKTKLKLCDGVKAELCELESVIGGTSNEQVIQEKCSLFLQNYGSHINTGIIEFGGVYRWRASYHKEGTSERQKGTNMVHDALSGFVSMSYSGYGITAGGSVSGNDIRAHSDVTASYNESELSRVTLNVVKKGGPQEVMSLPLWKIGLIRYNETWAVINRGASFQRDFVGIWDLIRYNAASFDNAQKLSETLQYAWRVTNSFEANTGSNMLQDQLTNFNLFIDSNVQGWNSDPSFIKNLPEYLRTLHDQVEQCNVTTGDSKLWLRKLQTHKPLQDFVSAMLQVRDQIPPADLSYIQLHLQGLMRLASKHDFPHRADLVHWLLAMDTQDNSDVTSLIGDHDLKDIPCLLTMIRETLLPAMTSLQTTKPADVVDIQATKDMAEMVSELQTKLEEDSQQLELVLLMVVLRILRFDPEKKVFKVLVSKENLEEFTTILERLYQEYQYQQGLGDVETLAFLVSCLVNSTAELEDEHLRQREFQLVYSRFQNQLPADMETFMNQHTAYVPYHWDTIRSTMDEVKKGNRAVLDNTSVDMADLNNIFGSKNQTHVTEVADQAPTNKLNQNEGAKTVLDKLGLTEYYPSKISLQNVMAVVSKSECSSETLPWKILQKLVMLDYKGRDNEISKYVETEKNNSTQATQSDEEEDFTFESLMKNKGSGTGTDNLLNPLDIFLAVFSCCDLILKQTLVYKMFTCRLAVPFLSPQWSDKSLQLSLWALRSIIIEWKDPEGKFIETSVVQQPLKTVSFMRLGKPSCSKSILLNHVLADQPHNTFWNRECPLSDTERQVADGLVECQWFLPSGKETDAFKGVTMFLNLRGDATGHKTQVEVMKQFSNVIVCCLESSDLEKPDVLEILKQLQSSPVKVILVLTVNNPESLNQQVLKKQYESYMNYVGKANMANAKVISAFKGTKVKTTGDLKQEIRKAANKLLAEQPGRVIEEVCLKVTEDSVNIDEEQEACKTARQLAQQVISCMGDKSTDFCKNTMLPLQGDTLQEWSKLLKEKERSGRKRQKSNVIHEMAHIQEKMTALRQKQLHHSKSLSGLMKTFLKNLTEVVDSPEAELFLQWLKIFLDEKCRLTLPSLRSKYHEKWTRLNSSKGEGESQNTARLKADLVAAEKVLGDASLGLEHLLRELAQIYEAAVESEKELNKGTQDAIQQLPAVAAKLLLKGQPIEIMDGDAANVPLTWVKAVFTSLKNLMGDKRLYVISVLGVQSSGKSTLLNTMFGLQFAASAGRCTRGAFMQLIEVQQPGSKFDFVLVVDTEGLRAPELGQTKHTHDNELATFVIGLGDVTIINVKGENMAEMTDVLQIAVHAFLRMKLVNGNFQLQRSCVFIHQNVPAVNAKDKMQQGCQKLQESLDEMTVEACAIENIADIHSFNQVIDFDRQKHVWYFSDLWHGDPPMAPVNPGYTEKVQEVKDCLLNDLSKEQPFLRFTDMILRIKDIWSGVLSDDFVFSFRNSLAAKAYNSLESTYYELTWKVESGTMDWLNNQAIVQLEGCVTYKTLEDCNTNLLIQLEIKVSELKETAEQALDKFFADDSLRDILIEWKVETMNSLSRDSTEFLNRAKREILQTKDSLRIDLLQRVKQKNHEEEILQKAKELADATRGTIVDDRELQAKFNNVWTQWLNELAMRTGVQSINIEFEVEKLLWQQLSKDSAALRKELIHSRLSIPLHTTMLEGSILVDDIQEEHLSVRTSVGQSVKNFFTGKDPWLQCRKAAVQAINAILRTVDIYLKDLSKQDCRFQESYATFVIKCIIDGIQKHNQHYSKQYPFTLLPNLKVKLTVNACRFAIAVFKKMQIDYDEKHSIAKKLDTYKNTAWNLFKNTVKQATKEVIAADLLSDYLDEVVKKAVIKKIPNDVVDEITRHFGHNKYNLILAILDDLASMGSFESYRSFLTNAQDFSLKWVSTFTNSTFFTLEGESSKYTKAAQSHIYGIIQDLEKSIKASTAAVTSQTQGLPSISTWCQFFRTTLTKIHVPESDLVSVMEQNVMDFSNLERLLIDRLRYMEESVLVTFRAETSDSIRWQGTTPYRQIIDKLWGCQAQCPFCNEPCQRTDPNHTTKNVNHQCIQHRTAGVGGDRWDESYRKDQLVVESCNYKVQWSGLRFNCRDCKFECRNSGKCSTSGTDWIYHNATEYKTYLPKWDIAPSSTMEASKYWMWFMATYKHQLKDMYNAQLPDIPTAWNNITHQQATDSLRVYYN